jgi:hypothetical protein
MKYFIWLLVLTLSACGNTDNTADNDSVSFYAPAPGTVIAADSMRIKEDNLNELYYSVSVTATGNSVEGAYMLRAAHGYNEAQSEIKFPKLTQSLTPAIRRDEQMPYSYIIGFKYDNDTTFNDYIRVFAKRMPGVATQIELRYLKSYYIDTVSKK